jgi:hypothetical protein
MNKIILMVIGAVVMFGCSTTNKEIVIQPEMLELKSVTAVKPEQKERPSWVLTGSGVSLLDSNESQDAFFGVGVKKYRGSPEEIQMDANDAARNSLVRVLGNFNSGLIRYHKAVKDPREPGWISKEKLQTVINDTTSILLLDSKIVGHWDQSDSNTSFSLARLDFKKVQTALASSNHLNGDEKTSIRFISKWVFKNMQLVRERKFLFRKVNQTIATE